MIIYINYHLLLMINVNLLEFIEKSLYFLYYSQVLIFRSLIGDQPKLKIIFCTLRPVTLYSFVIHMHYIRVNSPVLPTPSGISHGFFSPPCRQQTLSPVPQRLHETTWRRRGQPLGQHNGRDCKDDDMRPASRPPWLQNVPPRPDPRQRQRLLRDSRLWHHARQEAEALAAGGGLFHQITIWY